MAASYPGPMQVGSYFVGQYYQVLQQQPDRVHQFYSDASTMIRVDGDSTDSASAMLEIHSLVMMLNFTAIEIKTINSLASWNGGVLVMVSGSVKTKEFSGRRKFVQTFFLAPQEKGYFVLNDIFQFIEDEPIYHHPAPVLSENQFDTQLSASSPLPEQPASDYGLEEEAREYVNSVHIEDDPVDKYSIPEQQEEEETEPEPEVVVEETPAEEIPASFPTDVNTVQAPPLSAVEEPVGEPQKKTYASILLVAKSQNASSAATQPSFSKSASTTSDWNPTPQPTASQQSNYALSFVPESGVSSYVPESGFEAMDENLSLDEGEVKSVYVRNLPSAVTAAEIEQEFKNFGRIKPDGVFVRNRKDVVGVCYAFVEFEDISGVQNAIQASPIHLAGRQVYIEERRPNSSSTSRGGRRGRGRGSYQTEAPRGRFSGRGLGRGSSQDGGDYNRPRGNGFYQRG
ncbi:ras GTPase-activating protein-binding protein 2-like [Melia azedarach]|uniref:Ras GTPase-activating protein-binding protein 2-like n=1 Tax=Melia azedarach TaxID=155640 RepID=A0ACC1YX95_MELAZ|nr:ras GTPase-activating protein-binding protein 2-like [Melia azedarach]